MNSSIEFDWVTIPAGEFLMGSDEYKDLLADNNEMPQYAVYLPEYRIARVPVTNSQYKVFVDATEGDAPKHWKDGRIPAGKEDHPTTHVSWNDAQVFCRWAGVRLPTEPEWEKAARGTVGRIWPWGDEQPTAKLCNFDRNVGDTTSVGKYSDGASPYGLLDMVGNVWEWTSSKYREYPYDPGDGREDPEGDDYHTLRGGSFMLVAHDVRCANRHWNNPDFRLGNNGLRVVWSPGS